MESILSVGQRRYLRMIFDRGSESASQALSKWLGCDVCLTVSEVELADLAEVTQLLGPSESIVAACTMGLNGPLTGLIILALEDRSGLVLVDLLLQQAAGTTTSWGELEQSAAKETTNIVGCAYINALAAHLPGSNGVGELTPTPPTFVREFAGSLLEFALMEQALELDQILLIRTELVVGIQPLMLSCALLFIPSRDSLSTLSASLIELGTT